MAVLSLMHSIFSRKEFWKSVEKCMVLLWKSVGNETFLPWKSVGNCSASGLGRRWRGSKDMTILLSYVNKKRLPHLNGCGSLFISNQFVIVVQNVANLQFVSFTSVPASMSLSFLL